MSQRSGQTNESASLDLRNDIATFNIYDLQSSEFDKA